MKFWLRLAASALLIVLLLAYIVDAGEVVAILQTLAPTYIALAVLVVTIDRVLMAYKWTLLLKVHGAHLSLWQAVAIYCTSMVWGLALPATIGADAIRAVMVTRRGFDGAQVVSSIVVERVIGFVLALGLAIVCLIVLRTLDVLDHAFDKAVYAGIAMLGSAIVLLTLSMNDRLAARLFARAPPWLRTSRIFAATARAAAEYRALGASRTTMLKFGVLTVIEQVFSVCLVWVLARGMDIPVDALVLLGVLPLSTLLSRLPISFDGIGVFEVVFVGLLTLAGIAPEAAFAIALSGRFIQLAAFLPWWAVYSVQNARRAETRERSVRRA